MRACLLLAIAPLAIACGPSKVLLEPKDVTRVEVRAASGQALFCPGDPFQVELIVHTPKAGACSSTHREMGCGDKKDAVIDPSLVHLKVSPAMPIDGHEYTFMPDANPLATAGSGLSLQGWLEREGQKSLVGQATMKPVYACQAEQLVMRRDPLQWGMHGAHGPELHVFVTTFSTPWYSNAALIRIESSQLGLVRYVISPSIDKPVRIVARGQDGAPGFPGSIGESGKKGYDAADKCGVGGRGGDGGPGGPGGQGGDGGDGAIVHLHLDAAAADMLGQRVIVSNPGGFAGPGGAPGLGGSPGAGGNAGPSGPNCFGKSGDAGARGINGPPGAPGVAGHNGPPAVIDMAARATLFSQELPTITKVEATPAPH